MYCEKCGAQISNGERFCSYCGTPINIVPYAQPTISFRQPDAQDLSTSQTDSGAASEVRPLEQPTQPFAQPAQQNMPIRHTNSETSSETNSLCLILIIISAILWLFAPFVAVNLLTYGDQPTALQFITDDILYLGDLSDSASFWAALVSMIGIVVCFIGTLTKKDKLTRTFAIITEIPMVITLVEILMWLGDDLEDIFEVAGIGYWGILVLMFIVIFAGAKSKQDDTQNTDTTN